MAEFNLVRLYRLAFGYVAPPFPGVRPTNQENTVADTLKSTLTNQEKTNAEGMGAQLSLQPANRTVAGADRQSMLGNAFAMPTALSKTGSEGSWEWLPNEPIVSVRHRNAVDVSVINLSTDNTRPRRGSVKEIIALEDYEISIEGIAVSETEDFYPEDQINLIREFTEIPQTVFVRNYMLNEVFNIKQLTILNCGYPRRAGLPFQAQPYVIRALSDEDFGL